MEQKRLYRTLKDSWIAGVASGIGEYFNIDPVLIRILFIVSAFIGGGGVLIYIILWIVLPVKERENLFREAEIIPDPVEGEQAGSPGTKGMGSGAFIAGVILILLGLLFLTREIFPWFRFEKFWPVILILLGAVIILAGFSKRKTD